MKSSATVGDAVRFEAELKSLRRGVAKGVCKAYKCNKGDEDVFMTAFDVMHTIPSQMILPR